MLRVLRKKGVAKKIFVVLAVVIVPAFVLWGSASLLRSQQKYSYAGKILGRKVSFDEFQESLRAVQAQALLQFGEDFYKIQRFLKLELEAWDRLILLQETKKRKIKISDQEVVDEIGKLPFFQKNGKFDEKTYDNILDYVFKIPARFFEEQTRQRLMLDKLYHQITNNILISEEELLAAYKKENEKVKVSYLFISPANFEKDISLNKDEAENYFNSHRQEFKQPPTLNIQYFGLEYPKDAKEENKKPLQDRVMNIYSQLQKGDPLTTVAKINNVEVKETGFFSLEDTTPPAVPFEIIQTAFMLKEKQFSNPVLAANGCYIVRIKEKKNAYLPDFTEAKPRVEKILLQQRARGIAQENARQIHDKINLKIKNFNGWAAEFNLKVNQTQLFKLGEYLPSVGASVEFQNAAFNLKDKNTISGVVSSPLGFYILKSEEFLPIDEQKFKNEKDDFKEKLLEQKRKELFNNFFEALKKKANLQDNISKMKIGLY
ncbi:MAG: SurA N-terminal domain-containing protein [Candidatus Omnitrophota bacterium]|nr:SurA N-terminal domain-containing protein [Candidatus Omnitrophota bacterium]